MEMIANQQEMIGRLANERVAPSLRVDGLKIPTYSGHIHESARLFCDQIQQYFLARGTQLVQEEMSPQILAILGSALRGPAAQWYTLRKGEIKTVEEFFSGIHNEFVPADLQQRLRDQLHRLKQARCQSLTDYIAKFRQIMIEITDMSELDKVVYFQRGLKLKIQEEVQYRRCTELSEAIGVALDYV